MSTVSRPPPPSRPSSFAASSTRRGRPSFASGPIRPGRRSGGIERLHDARASRWISARAAPTASPSARRPASPRPARRLPASSTRRTADRHELPVGQRRPGARSADACSTLNFEDQGADRTLLTFRQEPLRLRGRSASATAGAGARCSTPSPQRSPERRRDPPQRVPLGAAVRPRPGARPARALGARGGEAFPTR